MEIGTLARIWRYPVKSLRGEALYDVAIDADGLEGDRTRALLVRDGHSRLGKPYRGKEDERLHLTGDVRAALASARERGVALDLDDEEPRYFDDAPVSLIVDRWLEGVSAHVGYAVEPERFRPNLFATAPPEMRLHEADLTGREIALGEVRMRVRYPIKRCVTTTYDQRTGESDPEILRYVAQARESWMGIYCDVLRAGTVRIGDALALVER
ncbi:MAG: MOSC domain-containing protein [bacterium]|nr:MOSC domain-containing protein [bacterium]